MFGGQPVKPADMVGRSPITAAHPIIKKQRAQIKATFNLIFITPPKFNRLLIHGSISTVVIQPQKPNMSRQVGLSPNQCENG
jgi:hypothetical protein